MLKIIKFKKITLKILSVFLSLTTFFVTIPSVSVSDNANSEKTCVQIKNKEQKTNFKLKYIGAAFTGAAVLLVAKHLLKSKPKISPLYRVNLSTERLVIRNFVREDFDALQEQFCALNTKDLNLYYSGPDKDNWTDNDKKAAFKNSIENKNSIRFSIIRKEDNLLIGMIGLEFYELGIANICYWIGKDYRNKGYCYESVLAFVDFILKSSDIKKIAEIKKLKINFDNKNLGSQKVAKKIVDYASKIVGCKIDTESDLNETTYYFELS